MARIDVHFICRAKYHDTDFARLEILKLLAEDPRIRTTVAEDYADLDRIRAADVLITYTCDLIPTLDQQHALRDWLAGGGRWFALHGTNSILTFLENGLVAAPRTAPLFMEMLGSQFVAHPPLQDFLVEVADPTHALTAGIEDFTTNDEIYLCTFPETPHVLLQTRFTGEATGFEEAAWSDDEPRPVMYLHGYGKGEVLYFNLGHCRSRYDLQPLVEDYPIIERCSWQNPVFYELLRRGLKWAHRRDHSGAADKKS